MKKDKRKALKTIKNVLFSLVVAILVAMIVFNFTHYKIVVSGNSMEPTVYPLEVGYMQKVYNFTKLERFDVVAVNISTDAMGNETNYIKRITGLPGENVSIINNVLFVNGNVVEQDFGYTYGTNADCNYTLGDNEYLISGDNRKVTVKSLVVTRDMILAKNGFIYSKYVDSSLSKKTYNSWRKING